MRYLILSDIHSNVEALESCVQRAKQAGYDSVLCCGDIVGYGPNPIEQYRRAALYIDRILKGEKPADLPSASAYEV